MGSRPLLSLWREKHYSSSSTTRIVQHSRNSHTTMHGARQQLKTPARMKEQSRIASTSVLPYISSIFSLGSSSRVAIPKKHHTITAGMTKSLYGGLIRHATPAARRRANDKISMAACMCALVPKARKSRAKWSVVIKTIHPVCKKNGKRNSMYSNQLLLSSLDIVCICVSSSEIRQMRASTTEMNENVNS
mmetsp:Transcript_9506/g.26269  ORF Transcript_9506/g.26269 Transcript_9506/m.26269 type:complete len:190 (-) Transcript_9506:801-1370(-)